MTHFFAIISAICFILCVGLGLFTISRNPRNVSNIGFASGMASVAVIILGNTIILFFSHNHAIVAKGLWLFMTGQAVLTPSWLIFSVTFARAKDIKKMFSSIFAICGTSIVSMFFILWFNPSGLIALAPDGLTNWDITNNNPNFVIFNAGRYFYIYILLGLVLNLIHLENTLRSSTEPKRWQIKYLILGVGAIHGYFIFIASQALLFSSLSFEIIPLTSSVTLISASIMALFIVRYRLLEVDIFISRYVVYNSFTILIVGIYLLIVGLITHGIKYFNIPFNYLLIKLLIFVAIFAFIIFLFTTSVRRKIKLFINRNFYKHKYEFRDKWMETIERIGSKRSIDEIINTLRDMIFENMCAKPIYLWLYDPSTKFYITEDPGRFDESLRKIAFEHPLAGHCRNAMNSFMHDDPTLSPEIKAVFTATRTVLCVPIFADDDVLGFVLLGVDVSGEPYIQDDFEFLKAIITQAAVQMKNLRLTQELMASREVEAFSRMASFIMHDLKNLTNSLSLISQNAKFNITNPEFQIDAIKTIDGNVSRMKRLIERLSNVPKDFDFKKQKTDVNELIQTTMKRMILPRDKDIIITNELGTLPIIHIDPEAIGMVLLNMITNAYDAIPKSGTICVRSGTNEKFVNITISDDGSGISNEYISTSLFLPFKTTKKNGFGIGLFQCKSIIEAHGGSISVKSEPNVGTEFSIRLPVDDDIV